MYGDSVSDLFGPNTSRTGDALLLARSEMSDPVRFDYAAYDAAFRDLQPTMAGASWGMQYPTYLTARPLPTLEQPTELMVEDRVHRRPAMVEPIVQPMGAATPIDEWAQVLVVAFLLGMSELA